MLTPAFFIQYFDNRMSFDACMLSYLNLYNIIGMLISGDYNE